MQGSNQIYFALWLKDRLVFLHPTDVISLIGGKDVVGMKQEEDTSFPVKIQGAGVESFELQVENPASSLFPRILVIMRLDKWWKQW